MRRAEDPTKGIEIVEAPEVESDYVIAGQKLTEINGELVPKPKTRRQIIREVQRSLPIHYWVLQDGYNDHKPYDAWEITVGDETVPLLNYAENVTVHKEHIEQITVHLALFAMHFSEYVPSLGAITVAGHLSDNLTADGEFKRHGEAQPEADMFAISPRTLREGIYRPDLPVGRIGAVVLHELAHFEMDTALANGWPKDRTTTYAQRFGKTEDIPESAAAYLLHAAKLSPEKQEILRRHDHMFTMPDMFYEHTPDYPAPEPPDIIRYYVDEEAVEGHQNK